MALDLFPLRQWLRICFWPTVITRSFMSSEKRTVSQRVRERERERIIIIIIKQSELTRDDADKQGKKKERMKGQE